MNQTRLLEVLIAILLAATAFAQPSPNRDARLKEAYNRLDAYVVREMRDKGIPGLSLALTDRNGLLRASTYGYADVKLKKPVTPETEFEIGSISKSFTAISLLQLSEQGKFDPRQPITKYLPWFSVHSNYRPITGHDVMSHSAGLPRDRDDIPSSLSRLRASVIDGPDTSPASTLHIQISDTRSWVICWRRSRVSLQQKASMNEFSSRLA
jgi:D-alanyl-D-alanine carboxypeptidase